MTKTGYVSKMQVEFDSDVVHVSEKDGVTRYRDCGMHAPWGLVHQRIREDKIKTKKGAPMFEQEAAVAA